MSLHLLTLGECKEAIQSPVDPPGTAFVLTVATPAVVHHHRFTSDFITNRAARASARIRRSSLFSFQVVLLGHESFKGIDPVHSPGIHIDCLFCANRPTPSYFLNP